MSIKLTVDNNFLDSLIRSRQKDNVVKAFQSGQLSFYPNFEFLSEFLGIIETKRTNLIPEYAKTLLSITGYRCLNVWNRITLSELGVIGEGAFVENRILNNLRKILKELSQARNPREVFDVAKEVKKGKDKSYTNYLNFRKKHIREENKLKHELRRKGQRLNKPKGFGEFYQLEPSKNFRTNLIKDIFAWAKQSVSEDTIMNIVNNKAKYPYVHTMLRSYMALTYRHIALREKVDYGDSYDFKQLIYLTNLDYLVSDDKRIYKLGLDIFHPAQKIINFNQLLNIVNNKNLSRG